MNPVDRRQFLRIAGVSLGAGALYQVAAPAFGEGGRLMRALGKKNGETPTPFSFVQFSDTHVGFERSARIRSGTQAFERAVEMVNAPAPAAGPRPLHRRPHARQRETGRARGPHARDFGRSPDRLQAPIVRCVPGEHDAGLDGGEAVPRDTSARRTIRSTTAASTSSRSTTSRRGKPVVGAEQLAWLRKDLARFPEDRADRRLHAPAALRPAARLGVVHERRRPGDERARAVRERDRALRPHPPRARPRGGQRHPLRRALARLRVPGSRGGSAQEAAALRPARPFQNLGCAACPPNARRGAAASKRSS